MPPATKPTEGLFHHPPAWEHDKAFCAWNAVDDDQRDAEQEAGEQSSDTIVDAVGEHRLKPAVGRLDAPEQMACAIAADGGGMHEHAEQQSLRVHRDAGRRNGGATFP